MIFFLVAIRGVLVNLSNRTDSPGCLAYTAKVELNVCPSACKRISDTSDKCLTESTRGVRHFVQASDIFFATRYADSTKCTRQGPEGGVIEGDPGKCFENYAKWCTGVYFLNKCDDKILVFLLTKV